MSENDKRMMTSPSNYLECQLGHINIQQHVIEEAVPNLTCIHCKEKIFLATPFLMNREEVHYIVESIKNEYLNKDTYYFASRLISRMQEFLESGK